MPFKIVQWKEKRTLYLEVVPSQWEKNGECWKDLASLQRQEHVVPNPELFYKIKCVLKRDNISSFKYAEDMADIMHTQAD